jgi:GNAT superfamily N-acetyltransferase
MTDTFTVVKTHPLMISYIDKLQRENAEALSFYPTQVFEREIEKERLFLGLLNGQPCGYIYTGAGADGIMRCHQVCIQYDARRRLYGAMLVVAMEEYANQKGCHTAALRCGFDLDANVFWDSLGYKCYDTVEGGVRRMRKINLWRKNLQQSLFEVQSIEPATGKTSAAFWAKHKKTGIVSQFVRGKAMKDYRVLLIQDIDDK